VIRRLVVTLGAAAPLLLAGAAGAQGTLSTQGFGYPPGQASTRAQGTGGALGEFDQHSPLNPAAIAATGRPSVYFQYSPEIRTVEVGGRSDRTVVTRFPVVSASVLVRDRMMFGVSVSTLADRTWQTDSTFLIGVAPDTSTATAAFRVEGSINDVRLAGTYIVSESFRVGAGLHALTGDHRVGRDLLIADTARFTPVREREEFSFSGIGASVGIDWRPVRALAIAASARTGGTVKAYRNDTSLARGDFPTRVGGAIAYTGIAGTTIAVSGEWEGWSRLRDLSSGAVPTFDATTIALGAEFQGPSLLGSQAPLRAGVRRRTLPFGLPDGAKVTETGIGGGIGLSFARGRAGTDIAIERSIRDADGDARERAWTVSLGFIVRL
jgi:hypothetical protein